MTHKPTPALTQFDINAREYETWLARNWRRLLAIVRWAMAKSRTE